MKTHPSPMDAEAFTELDDLLDDLRSRYDETPQWEFCEGFMAALACCRRAIPADEYLAVLLDIDDGTDVDAIAQMQGTNASGSFASPAQRERFTALWTQRQLEVSTALDTEVDSLKDKCCYTPELVDVRSAVATMNEKERGQFPTDSLPSFAQVWALGFMFAVESWPDEWQAPRDKDAAKWLNASLEAIVAMTEPDPGPAEISPLEGDAAEVFPTTSIARLNAFGDAIWATYDLRELWKTIGPRVETVRKLASPGRNDLCHCGSGKKFKKCHGA